MLSTKTHCCKIISNPFSNDSRFSFAKFFTQPDSWISRMFTWVTSAHAFTQGNNICSNRSGTLRRSKRYPMVIGKIPEKPFLPSTDSTGIPPILEHKSTFLHSKSVGQSQKPCSATMQIYPQMVRMPLAPCRMIKAQLFSIFITPAFTCSSMLCRILLLSSSAFYNTANLAWLHIASFQTLRFVKICQRLFSLAMNAKHSQFATFQCMNRVYNLFCTLCSSFFLCIPSRHLIESLPVFISSRFCFLIFTSLARLSTPRSCFVMLGKFVKRLLKTTVLTQHGIPLTQVGDRCTGLPHWSKQQGTYAHPSMRPGNVHYSLLRGIMHGESAHG